MTSDEIKSEVLRQSCSVVSPLTTVKSRTIGRIEKKPTSTHHHLCFFLFSRQAMTKLTLEILTPFQFCMWMRLIHWQCPMDWWCKTQDESSCICPILMRFDFHIVCIKQLRSQSNMANSWDHVYRVWQATIIRILINLTVCICIHRLMN